MRKKAIQKRRCVSMSKKVYEDFERYCRAVARPVSNMAEDLIVEALARGEASRKADLRIVPTEEQ